MDRAPRQLRRDVAALPAVDEKDDALAALLTEARRSGASHLHLVPTADGLVALLRIRGTLVERTRLPPMEGAALLERARLERGADTEPGVAGDRLVIALPSRPVLTADLERLGMPAPVARALRAASGGAGGLVLVAGPAGVGVTTTLREAVVELAASARPVLHAQSGGPALLRALLATDPDVIVIDRLTEPDSALAAMEAARDGRLVFAALDSADAVSAITMLRAMRIAPFHIASTLRLAIAQRLPRRLCAKCREPVQGDNKVTALLGFEPGTIVHQARGCETCRGTGHEGRIGLFEAVEITDPIRLLIDSAADAAVIASHAFRDNRNLASGARSLALEGVISAEEAIRVSRGG